jgi:hypothetical protein
LANTITVTANGTSSAVLDTSFLRIPKRIKSVYVYGTWNGASVHLLASPNGTTYVSVPDSAKTDDTIYNVDISAMGFKVSTTGAGASTSLTVYLL